MAFAGIKHQTSLLPPDQPRNKHSARVGSGIGALAVKKKAAARTAQEEILLELKPKNNQENPAKQSIKIKPAQIKKASLFLPPQLDRFF